MNRPVILNAARNWWRPVRSPAAGLAYSVLFFGILWSAPLFAQNQANVWRYSFLDDPYNALVEQDDSFWKTVELPTNMAHLGARAGQPVWLRTKVLLNASREKNHALYLGAIYDQDRVYFNGELIGNNGTVNPGQAAGRSQWTINGYGRPRIYPIPDQLIQTCWPFASPGNSATRSACCAAPFAFKPCAKRNGICGATNCVVWLCRRSTW